MADIRPQPAQSEINLTLYVEHTHTNTHAHLRSSSDEQQQITSTPVWSRFDYFSVSSYRSYSTLWKCRCCILLKHIPNLPQIKMFSQEKYNILHWASGGEKNSMMAMIVSNTSDRPALSPVIASLFTHKLSWCNRGFFPRGQLCECQYIHVNIFTFQIRWIKNRIFHCLFFVFISRCWGRCCCSPWCWKQARTRL